MSPVKLLSSLSALCVTVALIFLVSATGGNPRTSPTELLPKHTGSAVQAEFQLHKDRLARYYETLATALRSYAPDLLPNLAPPESSEHGYGVLPALSSVPLQPAAPARPRSAGYSWPWTRRLLTEHESKIVRAERLLEGARAQDSAARRRVYATLAREYGELRMAQANIDAHIGYNQFWQTAVASDRAGYDRQTLLHDSVLERQAIRDALGAFDRAATPRFSSIDQKLRRREEALAQAIEDAVEPLAMPWFVRVERPAAQRATVVLPVYTDIADRAYVGSLKDAVEKIWWVREGEKEFRVELAVSYLSADELYEGRAPKKLEPVSAARYLRLFPTDGAILTTGAATTHVLGRALILGPHAMTARVVAHEIGHLLGFQDRYFRGYRDLSDEGFEVLEIVAAPDDIMGAPTAGSVSRRHFERLLRAAEEPR